MKLPSHALLFLSSSLLVGTHQAYEFGVHVPAFPVVHHHKNKNEDDDGRSYLRFLVDDETTKKDQCFSDSEDIGEQIEARGAAFTANADCHNTNYCQVDASNHYKYNNYINVCQSLNGSVYKYDLQCKHTFIADFDGSTLLFTVRWDNLAGCFAPTVCEDDIVIDILEDYCDYTGEMETTGGKLVSMVCTVQDVRNPSGTVIENNIDAGECIEKESGGKSGPSPSVVESSGSIPSSVTAGIVYVITALTSTLFMLH